MSEELVKLSYLQETIAIVAMEDKATKNSFSKPFIKELCQVFEEINSNQKVKVVVIHGYGNFFCSGELPEMIATINIKQKSFTDLTFYRLLLDCHVPVIAAMQGHAIGSGLAFGALADLQVMAYEASYTTSFTPGFGLTYIIPRKFGISVADNMLYGAKNYSGTQLSQWGVSANFVKKIDVITTAIDLAKKIAEKSRENLLLLKQHLTNEDKTLLPQHIEKELGVLDQ